MTGQTEIFNEAADDYDNVGVDFFTPFGEALAGAAAVAPGDRVLDVGCERGAVLFPAAAAAGMVLFFLPEPQVAPETCRRLLRPGGRLAFSAAASYDPAFPRAMKVLAGHADAPPPPPPTGQGTIFENADTLRAAAENAGFARTRLSECTVTSVVADHP